MSSKLIDAVTKGDASTLRGMLGTLTAQQINADQVLFIACKLGHAEIVKLLVAIPGVDVDSKRDKNGTPLERTYWFTIFLRSCFFVWECRCGFCALK